MMLPNAAVNFTTSMGVNDSPGCPPMVPLMPEMLLINATTYIVLMGIKNTAISGWQWRVNLEEGRRYIC